MEKKKLSKTLLISFILGILYIFYIINSLYGIMISSTDSVEQLSTGISTILIIPHLTCTFIATLFSGLGLFLNYVGYARMPK